MSITQPITLKLFAELAHPVLETQIRIILAVRYSIEVLLMVDLINMILILVSELKSVVVSQNNQTNRWFRLTIFQMNSRHKMKTMRWAARHQCKQLQRNPVCQQRLLSWDDAKLYTAILQSYMMNSNWIQVWWRETNKLPIHYALAIFKHIRFNIKPQTGWCFRLNQI